MSNISFNLRLRPIRFAFLVRADDSNRVHDIFQINACLWGGKYNPIIPFFKRRPPWWERGGVRFENAKQIINGYLDFFEPDFLVEAEEGLADGFGFAADRVLMLTDLLAKDGERDTEKYGLDVGELYGDLYRKVFQFERRHKHGIVQVKAKSATFDNFVAGIFGSFPSQSRLEDFKTVFAPKEVLLDAESLLQLYQSGFTSALDIGCLSLKSDYSKWQEPSLFILDAQESRDLIDYWNLRAIHRDVVPVPIQWLNELSPFCKQYVLDNYRPLPGNPHGVMINPCSMFSRSIADEEIEKIYDKYLRVEKKGANAIQTWYPSIWREEQEFVASTCRPTLEADSKSIDLPIDGDKPELRFKPIFPEFASDYGRRVRWANVVRFNSWSHNNHFAAVFPRNYKNPVFRKYRSDMEQFLSTTEGLVFFPPYKDLYESWELTDGTTALKAWFNEKNITAVPSDAGRATQQIIQTLEGFWSVGLLANKDIIKFLNEMSRRPGTKSAHIHKFKNEINKAVSEEVLPNSTFTALVERQVVELGLELKCPKCGSWSWYSIKQLDYSIVCDLCLKDFDFPITSPSDSRLSRWSYRLIGPFALPEFARGGYAAALAIRFFAQVIGGVDNFVTWSSGQELTPVGDVSVEVDFILWYQRRQVVRPDYPTEIVFGEAKSFGRDVFKGDDVAKMKQLAETFPGSIIVFATMKEAHELSPEEIGRIRKLAQWGREYDKQRRRWRTPVIMLTGTELFTAHRLETSWRHKGGKHNALIKNVRGMIDNLRILANLTQHLYLGMPSYEQWREDKWKKGAERRKKKSS